MNLNDIRQDYMQRPFSIEGYQNSPIELLEDWYSDAIKENISLVNATTLSTIGLDGKPNSRVVLTKSIDKNGITIFTNYQSTKGEELAKNPNVSLNIYWKELDRQIRIKGEAKRISRKESQEYFQSRPKDSQISATASHQSSEIDADILSKRVKELKLEYQNQEKLPCPPNWGGYLINIDQIEFWQGRPNRLHDRYQFKRDNCNWVVSRLSP